MSAQWPKVLAGALSMMTISAVAAQPGVLIPRDALFGNPTRTQARLSPDGKFISWIAPRDGVLNVWDRRRVLRRKGLGRALRQA